ncbi:MAG: glycosyltransferase [Planctomycetes bacterium]|nr:glycosyltransferase [Planctomycetota bacterium]
MHEEFTIYFVIPAYNEVRNLPRLLGSLEAWSRDRQADIRVVLVDDGSTDGTAAVAEGFKALPVTVVRHEVNLGVHRVFQTGFQAVQALSPTGQDLIVTLEADNTSSLEVLDEMLDRARTGHDLVLASCYAPGGKVVGTTAYRRILSWGANLLLRVVPGMPRVHTYSSFYRVHRAHFFQRLLAAYDDRLIQMEGFVCVVELLLKAARLGARVCEVPMRLDGARRQGKSKMKTIRTIRGYLRLLAWALLGRLASPGVAPAPEGASQRVPATVRSTPE